MTETNVALDVADRGDKVRQAAIYQERIGVLYEQIRASTLTQPFAFAVTGYLMGRGQPLWLLASLLAAVAASAVWTYYLTTLYYRYRDQVVDFNRWARRIWLCNSLSGLIWGIAFCLFATTDNQGVVYFTVFFAAAVSLFSIPVLASHLPTYYTFVILVAGPVSVLLLISEDSVKFTLGAVLPQAAAVSMLYARSLFQKWNETFELRFDNDHLIEQLRQQKLLAEQANMAKTKFLAAASHDLRQPLHALTLFTEVLSNQLNEQDRQQTIRNIRSSTETLRSLFDALLDVSKLDAGVVRPQLRPFELHELMLKLDNEFRPLAEAKHLVWQSRGVNASVLSDPALLELVLRNLISNAVRYTLQGFVSLEARQEDDRILIEVSDSGVGIPEEKHQEVFQEFVQLQNPERDKVKGLGLGLAIVKRLVKLLDHDLHLESEPGKGSRFALVLPMVVQTETMKSVDVIKPLVGGINVLIIEDDAGQRTALQVLLQSWGYMAQASESLAEATELLAEFKPDVVIADYRLREHRNGVEAIQTIRQLTGLSLPGLIISGDTGAEALKEVRDSGLQLLHKPVAPARLRGFMRHVERRQASGTGHDFNADV